MAGDRILDGLNDAQREAVTHDAGPLLIVRGRTGKTTVNTRRRLAHRQRRARPEEIRRCVHEGPAEMEARRPAVPTATPRRDRHVPPLRTCSRPSLEIG